MRNIFKVPYPVPAKQNIKSPVNNFPFPQRPQDSRILRRDDIKSLHLCAGFLTYREGGGEGRGRRDGGNGRGGLREGGRVWAAGAIEEGDGDDAGGRGQTPDFKPDFGGEMGEGMERHCMR